MTESNLDKATPENPNEVYWCPTQQIYVGGVPENAAIDQMIQENGGALRVFGYGSLCWNPSGVLADPLVTQMSGRVKGYRRCWAQRSTDHRGTTSFPGIVCTLLTDDEFRQFRPADQQQSSMTEGLVYTVPAHLVRECLAELDFREKGGYARDIISVVEDQTGDTIHCVLYRGTPDSPAFWPRALQSLSFAAAVISAASGPSGRNEVYLHRLSHFLETTAVASTSTASCDDTFDLARMEQQLRSDYNVFFFYGCGSNQHNQLLLNDGGCHLVGEEDALQLTESHLIYKASQDIDDPVVDMVAGAGHSGVLTASGRLFLFGWDEYCQLGTCRTEKSSQGLSVITELKDLQVTKAALGFSHSLVVTSDKRLYAFGDNSRGQVTGSPSSPVRNPSIPSCLEHEHDTFIDAAAGLYHSVAVTETGELVAFGCSRHGQSLSYSDSTSHVARWKPEDGASVVKVACGRYHTIALDSRGRIWSFGDNRHGQLGRPSFTEKKRDVEPKIVSTPSGYFFYEVDCGWSHTIALARDATGATHVFGWGRSDKGQLTTMGTVDEPARVFEGIQAVQVFCGSESTVVLDDDESVWCCGWNEHGNLGTGGTDDLSILTRLVSGSAVSTPLTGRKMHLKIAAGGAHLLVARTANLDDTKK